ncbi:MAG: aldo/keto reductase family protein [Planctomycetia bacterium]
MKYRRLGRSGTRVSEVILGSWLTFGSSVDEAATARCVRAALEAGIQSFDTADVYAQGAAEVALGKALAGVPRKDVVLMTKAFWPTGPGPNDRGLSRKHVLESLEASLRRLGTSYVDLFQCHRFDPEVPLEETVRACEDAVRQGKALAWGVSVWTGAQVREALALARQSGGYGPVSNQPPYSLLERGIEAEVLPACRELGVGQVVFSPLAQGVLTGKYAPGKVPEGSRGADRERGRWMQGHLAAGTLERVQRLAALARERGTTSARLALAWCLHQPGIDAVIVGATRPEQVQENAGACEVAWDEGLAQALEALFRPD